MYFGIWESLDDIEDPTLLQNALDLPKLTNASIAESTLKKYKGSWKAWVKWSDQFPEVNPCPAEPFFIAIYIKEITDKTSCSIGLLTTAFLGIRWGHIHSSFTPPTNHPFLKMAFEGAKRIVSRLSPPKNKKEPLTPEIIKRIVDIFTDTPGLPTTRFIIICLVSFTGFLRISELLDLRVKHVQFVDGGMKLEIVKSKTDQLHEGNIIYIAGLTSNCCPVQWLRKYLTAAKILHNPNTFVICRLFKTKIGHNAHGNKPISYSSARGSFMGHLSKIVDNTTIYGLHSLRSGGATAAANSGISDRLIAKQGRWSSNSSRDGYIKDNPDKRFKVSKSLGI